MYKKNHRWGFFWESVCPGLNWIKTAPPNPRSQEKYPAAHSRAVCARQINSLVQLPLSLFDPTNPGGPLYLQTTKSGSTGSPRPFPRGPVSNRQQMEERRGSTGYGFCFRPGFLLLLVKKKKNKKKLAPRNFKSAQSPCRLFFFFSSNATLTLFEGSAANALSRLAPENVGNFFFSPQIIYIC